MKRITAVWLCSILGLIPILAMSTTNSFLSDSDAIELVINSILYLEVYEDYDSEYDSTASGFVAFNNETFVTNYHVIENAKIISAYDEDYRNTRKLYYIYACDSLLHAGEALQVGPIDLSGFGMAVKYAYAAITDIQTTDGMIYTIPPADRQFLHWKMR